MGVNSDKPRCYYTGPRRVLRFSASCTHDEATSFESNVVDGRFMMHVPTAPPLDRIVFQRSPKSCSSW